MGTVRCSVETNEAESDVPEWWKNVLNEMSRSYDFQIIAGSKVIEVRPMGIDKGVAVRQLLDAVPVEMVLAIGDDRTDEDIFKVMPIDSISIKVGMVPSFARYNVRGLEDVLTLLGSFARIPFRMEAIVV